LWRFRRWRLLRTEALLLLRLRADPL